MCKPNLWADTQTFVKQPIKTEMCLLDHKIEIATKSCFAIIELPSSHGHEYNMVFVLYQAGSPYDHFVTSEIAAGRYPQADANGIPEGDPNASGPSGLSNLCEVVLRLPNSTMSCNSTIANVQ